MFAEMIYRLRHVVGAVGERCTAAATEMENHKPKIFKLVSHFSFAQSRVRLNVLCT